ncbi:NADH dehydrogenase ubiquinone 1 alpha subcomplex subunit 5 [Taenia solium]|eukprot:TsM_000447500 transcript=TsM_000447500 gene=TsM_000447500
MMPETAAYRIHTEKLVNERLALVEKTPNISDLEKKIDCGQIEEVIIQARNEYELAKNMLKWKPWEPLVQEAPANQWKWPIAYRIDYFPPKGVVVAQALLYSLNKWPICMAEWMEMREVPPHFIVHVLSSEPFIH